MERAIWTILSCILYMSTAQAVSFDCSKASTKVERLICNDATLSKMDEELSAAYKNALQDEGRAGTIREAQKKWLKIRDNCVEEICIKRAYATRISSLTTKLSPNDKINAVNERLVGSWNGSDNASMSIYGTITITEKFISWNKNNNYSNDCKLGYQVQKEEFGSVFYNAFDNKKYVIAPDSTFTTFLLKITSDNCGTEISQMRFVFDLQEGENSNYVLMIDYDKSGNELGWVHFYRAQ